MLFHLDSGKRRWELVRFNLLTGISKGARHQIEFAPTYPDIREFYAVHCEVVIGYPPVLFCRSSGVPFWPVLRILLSWYGECSLVCCLGL